MYTASAQGFVDPVYATVTVEDGAVTQVTVLDSDSATDASYVKLVQNNAFLNQFIGRTDLIAEGEYDVVTGATFASNAVASCVNQVLSGTVDAAAKEEAAAEPAAEPEAEPVAEDDFSAGGIAYANGLTGTFPVTVALNADGTVKSLELGKSDSDMDQEYLTKLDDAFLAQFIGVPLPVTADTVTGATISSQAVIDAVNGFAGMLEEEAPEAQAEAAEAGGDGEYTVSAPSFTEDLTAVVTLENGTVTGIAVQDAADAANAPYVKLVQEEAFLNQFIGSTLPVEEYDTVTGATFSSNAVAAAVNEAFARAGINLPEAEPEAPATDREVEYAPVADGVYTVFAQGMNAPVKITVTVENGAVAKVELAADEAAVYDAPYVALVQQNAAYLAQFIGLDAPTNERGLDCVTGATTTCWAVLDGVNQVLSGEVAPAEITEESCTSEAPEAAEAPAAAEPATEEPAAEPEAAEEPAAAEPEAAEEPAAEEPAAEEPAAEPEAVEEPAAEPEAAEEPAEEPAAALKDGVYSSHANGPEGQVNVTVIVKDGAVAQVIAPAGADEEAVARAVELIVKAAQ